ncbi:hypothetical protein CQY20_28760 [Mycolicibacterium agri]|uniref:propane 2-monooxygenase n=1 Tax=Mycolicibacterium agri TaxID=36811 RepID=A0A2A7MQH1_MYCAG|nr:hypothetical protein [Mycolicibacterium agri]PEG33809.1 hypothetical protein CQY20_28760 [Mycolicibacterium agri]GFG52453.1 hypothetical protein MAGR_38940 [Mycolicibacterium agri]
MLVYSRVLGESAPEAFVLSNNDPTVGDLLEAISGARSAQGRIVELDIDGAEDGVTLTELGIVDGDLVTVNAIGEQPVDTKPAQKPSLDLESVRVQMSKGRRLNEYEEVTQLLQWHSPFHINNDRPSHQVWSDDSTLLRCSDWEAYRTPDKLYYRTYTTRQARAGRTIATAFEFAETDKQLATVDPARVELLRHLVGQLQYPDWGLCVTHQHTTRFALSSWIAGATSFMMFDELRHAQLYGRLALAYGEQHEGFDDPRPAWMESPRFQPTRRVIEEIMATLDWGKAIVLADLVVEPLHTTAAHALLTKGSLSAGDGLTPFVCRSIEDDKLRHRESAVAFLRLLCDDETHGDHNRTLISEWVGDLLPRAYAASAALLGNGVNPAEALWEARTWIQAEFAESGIETAALDVENKEVAV